MSNPSIYTQLAESIGVTESPTIPEIFKILANEKEAQFLLAASPPATVEEIAEKTGISIEEVEEMVDPLFKKGLIFKSKKPDAVRYYRVRNLMQFHDSTAVMLNAPREMLDLWKEFTQKEWPNVYDNMSDMLPNPVIRIIPVNVTIEPEARILAVDDVKNIVEKARNIAVTVCSCRAIDGACGKPLEVCMQLDKAADYAIERGTGRRLSKAEAIEMLKMCEDEGLVHIAGNSREVGHVICNCCEDCCLNWPRAAHTITKFVAPSRFLAVVDADSCSGCETCIDRCHFDAISMEGENDTALISEEKCMGCGLCVVTCPEDAINLKETRPESSIQ